MPKTPNSTHAEETNTKTKQNEPNGAGIRRRRKDQEKIGPLDEINRRMMRRKETREWRQDFSSKFS